MDSDKIITFQVKANITTAIQEQTIINALSPYMDVIAVILSSETIDRIDEVI